MNAKVKTAILIIAVIIVSALVSFISVIAVIGSTDRIFRGISVKGVDLGDMSRDEAGKALAEYASVLAKKSVTVAFEGGSGKFTLSDVDLKVNAGAVVKNAWTVGRSGNFLQQWRERNRVARETLEIPLEFSISKEKLRGVLDNITREVRVPPRDARIVITPGDTVEIVESSAGTGVDLDAAYNDLQDIIREDEEPYIRLGLIEVQPAQTTEDIVNLRVNGLIARFTTNFDIKKTNRVYNIRVAAAALDGLILKPGEEFSFNKVVGPRSQEAGYKLAPTILNREFIDSLGGGVCQVSTTLYNTLLLADIDILERSSHSLVVAYVPLGQDAAVAYGGKDLRFRNNLSSAIVIKTSVSAGSLTFKLFADTSLKKSVKIINKTVKEYPFKIVYKNDPTLPKGQQKVDQKGVKGYRVTSSMTVTAPDGTTTKKTLSSSYYAPLDQIVLVGTKPLPDRPTSGTPGGGAKPPGGSNSPPTDTGGGTPHPPPVTPPPIEPPISTDPPVTDPMMPE